MRLAGVVGLGVGVGMGSSGLWVNILYRYGSVLHPQMVIPGGGEGVVEGRVLNIGTRGIHGGHRDWLRSIHVGDPVLLLLLLLVRLGLGSRGRNGRVLTTKEGHS